MIELSEIPLPLKLVKVNVLSPIEQVVPASIVLSVPVTHVLALTGLGKDIKSAKTANTIVCRGLIMGSSSLKPEAGTAGVTRRRPFPLETL
jgi:hypothetical protein